MAMTTCRSEDSGGERDSLSVGAVIGASVPYLEARGVAEARLAVEHLAARLLRCKRLDLASRANEPLDEKLVGAMRRGVARLGAGEPVQHVLGRWDFRGISVKTDRRALIPRPETEELAQLLLDSPVWEECAEPRILDYGTGSGCIALAIASERPQARVAAIDISAEALELARENAEALGLAEKVHFVDSSEVDLGDVFDAQCFEAVISNPPYISSAVCNRLAPSVRDFEPRAALDGGPDGMDILRTVIEDASILLASGGMLFLEIGAEENQAEPLMEFLEEAGFEEIRVAKDLRGCFRFLVARLARGL